MAESITDSTALHSSLFPRIPIAVPMFVHFILVCLVLIHSAWLPSVYEFSHLCCFAVALWAIHTNEQVQSLVMLIVLLLLTILLDIIVLGLYFPDEQTAKGDGESTIARTWQFSAAMCIVNLLLKPLSMVVIVCAIFMQDGSTECCMRFKRAYNTMKNPNGQQNLEEGSQGFPPYQSEEHRQP